MDRRDFLKLMGSISFLPALAPSGSSTVAHDTICLGRFSVAGFQYHQGMQPQISRQLLTGADLQVERDYHNPYDPYAVRILTHDSAMLGYLPRNQNRTAAIIADQGIRLSARIIAYKQDAAPWERLTISLLAVVLPTDRPSAQHGAFESPEIMA